MNLLKKTKVYLIGSMQNDAHGNDWRLKATKELEKMKIKVFNPYFKPFINEIKEDEEARAELKEWLAKGDFHRVSKRMKAVRADDLRLCDLSDFFIACIDPVIASYGSCEEIYTANREKKPLFIVVKGGKKQTPLWLLGMIPDHYFYDSLDDALEMIRKIDNGEVEIDSGRWRLLKEEYR